MKFLSLAVALAAATMASAENTITFASQDSTDRTVHFTGNPGMPAIAPVQVAGGKNVTIDIPYGWTGNFFSVSDGQAVEPGMLGEVAFNSWNSITFYDVSAIVNPLDHVGVKQLYPAGDGKPTSGCRRFPCAFAYYHPDDIQTQGTHESDLICTLGDEESPTIGERDDLDRQTKAYPREFVVGRGSPSKL